MWQEKQRKEIINREICKNRLKRKLLPLIPLTGVLTLISVLLTWLAVSMIADTVDMLMRLETVGFGDVIWAVFLNFSYAFTTLLIDCLTLMLLVILINGHYKINKGRFYAVEDTLAGKAEHERIRFPNLNFLAGRRFEENAFYFSGVGRYALSPADISAFDYSSVGDTFYVIVYDGKKQKPQLAYNMKIYKWEER